MGERNRISRLFYFEGVAFGLFMASVSVSIIELVRFIRGEFQFSESPWTLILPIVASTYVSVRAITEQSRLQIDVEIERLNREKLLAQAELPMCLSDLIEQCRTMILFHFRTDVSQPDWKEFNRLLDGLKPAIKSSNPVTANRLLKIIRTYQVLRARMREFDLMKRNRALVVRESKEFYNIWENAVSWATLHAMVEQAFDYARGSINDIPSEEVSERVFSAFLISDVMIDSYPILQQILRERAEHGFEMTFSD